LLRRNSHPRIGHREAYAIPLRCELALHGQPNRSVVGKFERVGQEIEERLPQPSGITIHPRRDVRCNLEDKRYTLREGLDPNDRQGTIDQSVQIERDALELDFAGLEFRKIENVVDDPEQRSTGIGK